MLSKLDYKIINSIKELFNQIFGGIIFVEGVNITKYFILFLFLVSILYLLPMYLKHNKNLLSKLSNSILFAPILTIGGIISFIVIMFI